MDNFFDISGKTALITGGSRGVGKMIAQAYVERGVRTYITARHKDVCEETAQELSAHGECFAIQNDQGSMDGVHALAGELKEREKSLDILVNNAGTGWHQDFDEFPEEGWDKTFNLNIKSVFFLTQQLAPLLRAAASPAKPAKVINISSTDALWVPDDDAYPSPASKAGLLHLTRKMAHRLVRENIHVNVISPGAFGSNMNVMARDYPEEMGKHIPAGRVGDVNDIGGTAVYMASRAGDYLVGVNLTLDGGCVWATTNSLPAAE